MSRLIDADALKDYIDMQKGRPFIGCTVGEALKIMVDEQPTIQPDNSLQKLSDEIAKFKRTMRSSNSDYFTGYMSALSMVEGMIAEMMPHEPCEEVTE